MQRGIIQLTPEEQSLLSAVLEATPLRDSLINARLSSSSFSNETTGQDRIEISADEAESLLDTLPIPSPTEPTVVTVVREKLTEFIQNL